MENTNEILRGVNTFLFVDPKGKDEVKCETRISISERIFLNLPQIFINLDSSYIEEDKSKTPINNYNDFNKHTSYPLSSMIKSFSVIKNEMTEKIVEFILKEDFDLAEHTGSTTPIMYRRQLLNFLAELAE